MSILCFVLNFYPKVLIFFFLIVSLATKSLLDGESPINPVYGAVTRVGDFTDRHRDLCDYFILSSEYSQAQGFRK